MRSPKRYISIILIAVLTLAGCFSTCYFTICFLANGKDIVLSGYGAEYDIITATVLDELAHGNINVFVLRESPLLFRDKTMLPPISWTQKDFLLVADGLNQTIRGETLKAWQLYDMNYMVRECANAPFGIQEARLDYFTVVTKTEEGRDIVNYITFEIFPRYENVIYGETVKSILGFLDWGKIDITKITIPADVALNIVEDGGGRAFRESINNDCEIDITLNQSFWKSEWQIEYWAFPPNSNKVFLVDAQSGEVSIGK